MFLFAYSFVIVNKRLNRCHFPDLYMGTDLIRGKKKKKSCSSRVFCSKGNYGNGLFDNFILITMRVLPKIIRK